MITIGTSEVGCELVNLWLGVLGRTRQATNTPRGQRLTWVCSVELLTTKVPAAFAARLLDFGYNELDAWCWKARAPVLIKSLCTLSP